MAREILQIRGFDELDRKLKTLDKKVQKKVSRAAVKESMQIVLHAARSAAPVLTGLLVSTLRVVTKSSSRRGTVSAVVRTRDGDYKGDTFYASFVEFGHRMGKRVGKATKAVLGDTRAAVEPQPFLRPALDENGDRVISKLGSTLGAGIEAVAKEPA